MERCIWCHSEKKVLLLQRRDRLGEGVFAYLRCARCGLVRLEPQPTAAEMVRYYPQEYECFQEKTENWLFRRGRRRMWAGRLQAIRRYFPHPGRVLDIGCAHGEFLEIMQQQGWEISGIEPHPPAAARAQARLGAAVVQTAALEEADLDGPYDLVTLWDVLEHLPDPVAALERLAGALRPGGYLALGIPNLESWDAHLFGRSWIGWDAPRHLYLFPDATLREMLAAKRLQVVAVRCLYGGYGAFILSLDTALRERYGDGPAGRRLRRLAALRPGRYLLWPYFRLAETAGRGPVRTYFCRRTAVK